MRIASTALLVASLLPTRSRAGQASDLAAATLTGRTTSAATREAIAGVDVVIELLKRSTRTAADGSYRIGEPFAQHALARRNVNVPRCAGWPGTLRALGYLELPLPRFSLRGWDHQGAAERHSSRSSGPRVPRAYRPSRSEPLRTRARHRSVANAWTAGESSDSSTSAARDALLLIATIYQPDRGRPP